MLLGDQKVAIFEGTYSEIRGKEVIENLKPRRRGYKIGESLGGYKIKTIHKTHATLSAIASNNITLTISKTPATNKIQKSGDHLIQKSKSVSNKTTKTTSTSRIGRARRAQIQKKRLNAETTSTSRASRARRTPIQKKRLNRVPPKVGAPRANPPPAISTPGAESPDPSNPRRPQ
jgi:tRNA 2-selenouridine synthase SelU